MNVYTDAERLADTLRVEARSDAANVIDALLARTFTPEEAAALYDECRSWPEEHDPLIAKLGQIAGDR